MRVSFCAPGAPGRGNLATLIAAQRMVRMCSVGFRSFLTAAPIIAIYSVFHIRSNFSEGPTEGRKKGKYYSE